MILAAGRSSRLGVSKQLLEYEGEPLIRRAARSAFEAGINSVFVVLGADAANMSAALSGLPVTQVINDEWQSGIASSLRAGVKEIRSCYRHDGILVTVVDQPFVTPTALARLIAAFDESHRLIASAYSNTVGVPAIFGKEFFDDLENLEGDTGASSLLRERSAPVTTVALPEAELDIDTKADLPAIDRE